MTNDAYLPAEAILSHATTPGPLGEAAWLEHALRGACRAYGLDLGAYVGEPGQPDLIAAFMDEQYRALRCATFHAKQHKPLLLPGVTQDRLEVLRALEPLGRLVLDLLGYVVGMRYPSGGLTHAGFDAATAHLVPEDWTMSLTRDDSELRGEQTEADLPDGPQVDLAAVAVTTEPGLKTMTFRADREREWPVEACNSLASFHRGMLSLREVVPDLVLGSCDRFEVDTKWVLDNPQQPRTRFTQ